MMIWKCIEAEMNISQNVVSFASAILFFIGFSTMLVATIHHEGSLNDYIIPDELPIESRKK